MKYERFEQLAIGVGALAVIALMAITARDLGHNAVEIVAELMMLVVLAAAVHFGRRGGFIAAVSASALYVLLSVPGMAAEQGLTSHTLLLLAVRIVAFGLIGIVGGEACGRLRQMMTRLANSETYDEWSHVFNQHYAYGALLRATASSERYGHQFAVVLLSLAPSITADLGPQRVRTLVRSVSGHLHDDLRMVDEVARLDDGRFFVLLPSTPLDGGKVVATRLANGVRELLGAREESVTTRCLGSAEDATALAGLAAEIAPPVEDDEEDQSSSGE